jgi:hypothetical protein
MPLRPIVFLYLLLAPLLARAALPEVRVSEYHSPSHGRGLKLTFATLRPDPTLERFTLEEAREVVMEKRRREHYEELYGPSPLPLEELFARAGMLLEAPANRVYLINHQGPHPEAYHREVYRRLEDALGTCQTQADCRNRLVEELDRIAADICKPDSRLNKLATKKP